MKTIKNLFKFTFISAPKTLADQVVYNSAKIGFLTVLIMILMVFMTLFGNLPIWSIIK